MPQLTALSCPVCAAPLAPDSEKCSFCGSYIVIKTDMPRLDRATLNQSLIQDHIVAFRQRVRSDPYDEEAHYGLGIAYFSLGLIDEAIDELTQAAKLMPENPHIQAQLAVALHESFKAGNSSAEQQMHARIHSALLLDPAHAEATLLKAEVLLEKQHYEDAIKLFHEMPPPVQERMGPKVVSSLEDLCDERLRMRRWGEARWCWAALTRVDLAAAKRQAVRFLNMHASLVPRTFKSQATKNRGTRNETKASSSSKGISATILAAFVGLVVGSVQLIVVALIVSTNEHNTISGWDALALVLSITLLLASPLLGAICYRIRRKQTLSITGMIDRYAKNKPERARAMKVRRQQILSGTVDMVILHQVVDVVMEKLRDQEERDKRKVAARNAGRHKRRTSM